MAVRLGVAGEVGWSAPWYGRCSGRGDGVGCDHRAGTVRQGCSDRGVQWRTDTLNPGEAS